ncbi:docking domain of Afi1 for Arf3 in vesicle trafficking-domain-containing protein [Lophiotrema nucula]|uniref:Docking domain of Afi1 for Arf3 in vesicle trafficking-domain-containing protein n=1 Tax=Lophiotrema nucula TaxID=690887 RepID=A0A6A5YV60_9PLEO|nr:docking domain of Afi1 for Arf3 in vesicle trafficking-domain-containing protein [Lophiotrema nucula]
MAARTNGGTPQPGLQRQPSFSSFPPSRSTSSISFRNDKKARSPQPPMLREDDGSLDSSPRNSSLSPRPGKSKLGGKVRSQYPADSVENHVEYILVASFDIDRGSVMEHQYPGPISGDETMLAELMLPDQAHVRSQDWTIFFLHKDTTAEDEEREARRERRRKRRRRKEGLEDDEDDDDTTAGADEDEDEKEEDGDESTDDESTEESDGDTEADGPPLIYVLNLVNTKQDNTVKRGAIVKAMAICTRHSFLHIYKPLLLLALEEYFRAPVLETLASLYNALNAMDLSLLPKLSSMEQFVLQASDSKDMFIEKFDQMIRQRKKDDAERDSLPSEEAPGSELRKKSYAPPRDTHEFESKVNYNGIPVPIKVPTALSPETVGDFSLIKLIQTFSAPHTTQPQPFALHPHLTTSGAYTHPIIVLVNALLTQKRIIFLGHNRPSSEVAEAVLAASALASGGLLRGFVRYAFPYTDLTKIDDLLKVPGFIAGVTNPAFAHKPEWWDVLCDLPTGRMKISHRIEAAPATEGSMYFQQQSGLLNGAGMNQQGVAGAADPTGDSQFMDRLLQSIADRHGENAIRAKWRSWILKFTRIAAAFEETVYGASALYIGSHETDAGAYGVSGHGFVWPDESSKMRELAANVHRIEGWRSTRSYYSFVQDLAKRWDKRPVRGIDFHHQHDRLRCLRLSHDQSAAIYLAFARAVKEAGAERGESPSDADLPSLMSQSLTLTPSNNPSSVAPSLNNNNNELRRQPSAQLQYDTILQLLIVVPESNSGLFYIALGLFHPRQDVRIKVVELLERILEHPAGRHFWAGLGRFAKLAFFRVKREEVGHGR